jgi:hypothetical protein
LIRYLPFDDGPHKLAMGVKPLDLAEWIEIDEDLADDLGIKDNLLAKRHADVFAGLDSSQPAQAEVLETLLEHLARHCAAHYRRDGDVIGLKNSALEWNVADAGRAPLDVAGRLVQEDLCVMEDDGSGIYRLTAASLCFPTRWQLADKIGRPVQEIHGPVPGYDERLATPMDRFFIAMQPENPVWRVNWSLVDTPELHLSIRHGLTEANPDITSANAGDNIWLRVERQTLRRLPETGAILFTIRIYRTLISDVVREPGAADRLRAAINNLPDDTKTYKSILPFEAALTGYLAAHA